MRVMRLGMSGDDVRSWQTFLCGIKCLVVISGTFDAATTSATKSFQRLSSLTADGIVGPLTMSKALALGYSIMIDDDLDAYPARPGDMCPLTSLERAKLFGTFSYVSDPQQGNPEAIRITDGWARDNIRRTVINVQGKVINVDFHVKAIEQLTGLFEAWEAAGLSDRVLSWGGSWAPRFIRGSRTVLSNHAFGTAFDINVQWNVLGAKPIPAGQRGSVCELVQIANEHGFWWGGHFNDRLDGQHFEISRLI